MVQLRHCNNLATLAKFTVLRPVKRNVTCWSSAFEMLQRYVRIRNQIKMVEAVEELVLSGVAQKKLVALLQDPTRCNSVCKKLQTANINLSQVRKLFDQASKDFPVIPKHFKLSAKIIHLTAFESALVKIIDKELLMAAKAKTVRAFETSAEASNKRKDRDEDYVTAILNNSEKWPRSQRDGVHYSDFVSQIPLTSNTVKRVFSQCNLIMSPHRSSMLSANFEMIAFLRVNSSMWNAASLVDVDGDEVDE